MDFVQFGEVEEKLLDERELIGVDVVEVETSYGRIMSDGLGKETVDVEEVGGMWDCCI